MQFRKAILAGAFLFLVASVDSTPALAQATNCTANQAAAIQCFVAHAVVTNLMTPRYGMTLTQFEAYGVSVSHILQTHDTYLMLVGTSSAIADAMPPTNANGTANQAAQDLAVTQIVAAVVANRLVRLSSFATLQDLQWFSLDITNAMNDNNGVMELLTPGVSLRIIDSYLVTATSNGQVNWTTVGNSLSSAVDNFVGSGMMKVPPGMNTAEVKSFVTELAHIIADYKVATGRKTL